MQTANCTFWIYMLGLVEMETRKKKMFWCSKLFFNLRFFYTTVIIIYTTLSPALFTQIISISDIIKHTYKNI